MNSLLNNEKCTESTVPSVKAERDRIYLLVETYIREKQLTPPLSEEELAEWTEKLLTDLSVSDKYRNFITVLINNEVWKPTVASIPFERRVMLIPQCLRSATHCKAEIDEFGLLCEQCGSCVIGEFQKEAEELGYVVLVAEGTTVVTRLIESGKIDAVIGISCLSVLEKTFPHMASGAVPGIAVPLTVDGCSETLVDNDRVYKAIRLKSEESGFEQINIPILHDKVKEWFEYDSVISLMGKPGSETETIALKYLTHSGKRWRPLLLTAVCEALKECGNCADKKVKKLAVAVECFHKASLIHDDIEDKDTLRYGVSTLHVDYGVPVALNIGDLLIGEGYRLIAECGAEPAQIADILKIAAFGHKTLCVGQGTELLMGENSTVSSTEQFFDVFRWKTSPAFNVALQIGGIIAKSDKNTKTVLNEFSDSLGIAYQIHDDLNDFADAFESHDTSHLHSSILTALAAESCETKNIKLDSSIEISDRIFNIITELNIEEKAHQLCEHFKNKAVRSLAKLQNSKLKSFLRRVVSKIVE